MAKAAAKKATPRKPQSEVADKLEAIVGRLAMEAQRRVTRRKKIEDRWLDDHRQFNGQYDPKLLADLLEQEKSTLFINETMPKTLACSARLFDMLFPTDLKNWGIGPTPVPTLAEEAIEGMQAAREAVPDINAVAQQQGEQSADALMAQVNARAKGAEDADETLRAAKKAASAMELEIADQLTECQYAAECREVIEDMAKVGAGVMEGPVAADTVRQVWKTRRVKVGDQDVIQDYLEDVTDPRPAARRVDYWGFFPQDDAMKPEESSDFFVRRLYTERQLRRLARQPGFDKNAIRDLITEKPKQGEMPSYLSELRAIGEGSDNSSDPRFVVWEYRGQLTADDLKDVCDCLGARAEKAGDADRQKKLETISTGADDMDPLDELNIVLWFCQGKCLKFGIHHLDRGEQIYSVVPLEKDASSMWGLGIPALMRDPQSALNAAWRMMMDNGGLSSSPMFAFNRKKLIPVDGNWELYARKLFDIKDGTNVNEKLYEMLEIASNQGDYAAIVEMAKGFIETMSGQPAIAQGEQPASITKTLGGMSMLMNAANILIRRIVRNFDDRLTTPMIRRFYDWNMQFNKKREIKGDFKVDALGSSVLLVKELQSQNIMAFALNFAGHPIFGRFIKPLETIQEVANTNMIPASKVLKTEAEVKQEIEAEKANGPPKDPETIKAEAQIKLLETEYGFKKELALIERDTAMYKVAATMNWSKEELQAHMADKKAERDHKERIFISEAAMESRNAGGGASGGYLSAPPAAPAQGQPPRARGKRAA